MKINTDPKKINKILERETIVQILPSKKEFKEKLLSGKKLRFYIGFDATAPVLHLSHAKNFMLMEKFRQLGHEVIILFGDFTARIGDPTGKKTTRQQLTREKVMENVKAWKDMIKPLMNFKDEKNPPIIKYNHDWLSKLTLEEVIELASNFTVQQILERDMFQKRLNEEKPIYLHEFLYPLMQGYDSVAMNVDVEVCGTDQIFNSLAGRTLLKKIKDKDKFVVAVTLMENPKTGELMSKSKGAGVFINVPANDLYGQVMAQPDEMIEILFINNTLLSLKEIKEIMQKKPKDAKMRLAYEITKIFHGEEQAKKAEQYFVNLFQKNKKPENIKEYKTEKNKINIVDLLNNCGLAKSKSEARRLIKQGGVKIDDQKLKEEKEITIPEEGLILQKGKRNFRKIILK
jgi:tyrosyl-tRNA synthetase